MPSQKELAMQLMEKKKFSEAIPFFLELIESKSDDKGLYYMLGQCYRFTYQIKFEIKSNIEIQFKIEIEFQKTPNTSN